MAITSCTTWDCINSFSNWISAVGTVAATSLALWLSIRDRRINLFAKLSVGLVPGANPRVLDQQVFAIEFTNQGPRTVIVTNHAWRLPFVKGVIYMFPNVDTSVSHLCSKLPLELTDGKVGHTFYAIDHFTKLDEPGAMFFHTNRFIAWVRINFVRLYINTSVGKKVRVRVHRDVRRELWRQYSASPSRFND